MQDSDRPAARMAAEPQKLKRVIIKEELVALIKEHAQDVAKPYIAALILNQFLYWTERVRDFDAFIIEEKARNSALDLEPTAGWVYKNAEDLADELMIDVSAVTIRREIARIVTAGYLEERHNPKYRWDRTIQYRINLVKLQHDLQWLGYTLEGYPLLGDPEATFKMKVRSNTVKVGDNNLKVRVRTFEAAIPETTTETTSEEGETAPAIASAPPAPEPKAERKATGGTTGNRRISAPAATRLQIDTLPDDWRAYVDDKRPDLSADALFEDFSDYWRGAPGQKGVKSDWPATWRRWVRESTAKPHLLRQQAQAVGQRPERIDLGPYADWVRRTKATLETTDPRYQELVKIQQRRYMTADEFHRLQPQAREVQYV